MHELNQFDLLKRLIMENHPLNKAAKGNPGKPKAYKNEVKRLQSILRDEVQALDELLGALRLLDVENKRNFITQATELHGGLYSYDSVDWVRGATKSHIVQPICALHGLFTVGVGEHLRGKGCPTCLALITKQSGSKGEILVENHLISLDVTYAKQKTFDTCINPESGYKLRFDFYLPDHKLLIEYDGEQHFKPFSFGSDRSTECMNNNYEAQQFRDKIKTDFVESTEGLTLLRIPYYSVGVATKLIDAEILRVSNL